MSEKDQKKRKAPISYRPPASLQEEFEMRVKRSGKSVNGFITSAIFSGDVPRAQRTPPVEREMLAKLLFQAAQIRDELRVIAEADGNQEWVHEHYIAACQDLSEIRAAVLKFMGRVP
jgi:hypothetical protein